MAQEGGLSCDLQGSTDESGRIRREGPGVPNPYRSPSLGCFRSKAVAFRRTSTFDHRAATPGGSSFRTHHTEYGSHTGQAEPYNPARRGHEQRFVSSYLASLFSTIQTIPQD